MKYDKRTLSELEMNQLLLEPETWLMDKKGKDLRPAKLSKTISAFANSNGGEVYLGIGHLQNKRNIFGMVLKPRKVLIRILRFLVIFFMALANSL